MTQAALQIAPLYADLALGPEGGEAFWLTASDGLRIRAGVWPVGDKGTVLLFPGRTEYIEKYGLAATDLQARGYATLAIDWRGQGLADRMLADRLIGHVARFQDYQLDVQAVLDLARQLGLPEPYYVLSHSMGGAIALRALMRGLPVKAAAFSAPMWGIAMAAWMRPFAQPIAQVSGWFGQAHRFAPSTSDKSYVMEAEFGGNVLTTDPEMWRYMKRQVTERPELALAGPSLGWLHTALAECRDMALAPAPDYPALTALGTAEKVVDVPPVHLRMAGWRNGRLEMFIGAEHEIPMETLPHRKRFFDLTAELFDAHR
ncbi:MAG: alpha/beta hydrolase [Pseudotabrizicola sp.]|uniref:alpha/beta fold hydrolase n=1 Tax=Pseudotabrizicola sp. TaxID=2939647 RepID=UPI002730D690|nr:alpha/beta hydrolase [Pseudotabrizicola sp.]MDP2082970.1 alpha/beta hydrolase [Pseudotabrizicola sp.]MDZ7574502.1 alpha/beta hydrolase [Pseudotabrizicola sp.]